MQLASQSLGTGDPLVLVNGYAAAAADWDPTMLGVLAESFRVVCLDNRGIGSSELGPPDEVTIDAMAADVVATMDALGIDRAPVVGWSMASGGLSCRSCEGHDRSDSDAAVRET